MGSTVDACFPDALGTTNAPSFCCRIPNRPRVMSGADSTSFVFQRPSSTFTALTTFQHCISVQQNTGFRARLAVWRAFKLINVQFPLAICACRLQERISAPPPVAGLPEGISQRDDVYTKAEAFLTHVPNLD